MTVSLTIESRMEEIDRVSAVIEELGERSSWPAELVYKISLVLEELTLNIMKYGYDDDAIHLIDVALTVDDGQVTIEIIDDGRPFDPVTDAPVPDLNAPVHDRAVGGWGVHLVKNLMDDVSYRRDEGKNRIKLTTAMTN